MSDDNKFYAMVFSKNIAVLICFTILSIYFNHWWIVFFSALFWSFPKDRG